MTLKLVPEDGSPTFILNHKAFNLIATALDHQIKTWQALEPSDRNVDDFADLQNDLGYFHILCDDLKTRFSKT